MSDEATCPADRYSSSSYLSSNPSWDMEDSPWKSSLVGTMFSDYGIQPGSICEVGCGAGACLAHLREQYPTAKLVGYDIAPDAQRFWQQHKDCNIEFHVGDFLTLNKQRYNVLLLLDVIEHIADPHAFLMQLRGTADHYVFHIPLDLSAISVLREKPLLYVREKVGHIHYFTRNLALALLAESGYQVKAWRYTGAATTSPQSTPKTWLAQLPRKLAYAVHKDMGVRLLGGETLLVLAEVL